MLKGGLPDKDGAEAPSCSVAIVEIGSGCIGFGCIGSGCIFVEACSLLAGPLDLN